MTSQEEQKPSYFRKLNGLPGLCNVTKEVANDDGTVSMWGWHTVDERDTTFLRAGEFYTRRQPHE